MAVRKLLTLRECSERTGHRESTWRAWVLHRRVPYFKVGRSVRISEADLDGLIEASRVPPKEPRTRTKRLNPSDRSNQT
jgi:excisionase family DNA binding protein